MKKIKQSEVQNWKPDQEVPTNFWKHQTFGEDVGD